MVYTVVTTTNARRDISDAIDWEDMRKPGLSQYFLQDLEQKIAVIAATPHIFNVRYENIRCAVTNIFSYLIHYTIDETNQRILFFVCFILHGSLFGKNNLTNTA